MAIRIDRPELLQILSSVSPGLSTKDIIQQSSCFVFRDGWVVTFNGEVACRTKTGLPGDFEGAVHGDPLLQVLNKIQDQVVTLEPVEGELRIRAVRTNVGIRMESDILLPTEEIEKPEGWVDIPLDFDDALKKVKEAAGTNREEFLTVCIHIHPEWIEACDRFQATRYMIELGVEKSFLVRKDNIQHVIGLEMSRMSETENWVHFRNPRKGLVVSCRRHVESYPDLGPMLEFRGKPANLPTGTEEAADLAAVFSGEDKDNNKVVVSISPRRMAVRGEGTYGWATKDLEMEYEGEEMTFRVSPTLLVDLVKNHKTCEIGTDKLRVAGDKWTYITVLGKVGKEKKNARRSSEREADAEPVEAGVERDRD